MAFPPSSYGTRGPSRGLSRSFTVPHRQLSVHERAGLDQSDAEAGILYTHPGVKIFSFAPPPESINSRSSATHPDADYPIDTIETLPWRSRTEILLASGPLFIEKVRGSVACFKCGVDFVQPIVRNSQCWCVDGESKFVLRRGKLQYYRFELPTATPDEQQKVAELRAILGMVLKYESTPCPFKRAFHVELPDDAIKPRRKGKWKPKESLPATVDEAPVRPLRRSERARTWRIPSHDPLPTAEIAAARRASDYGYVQTPRPASLRTSYLADRPETPSSMSSGEELERRRMEEDSDDASSEAFEPEEPPATATRLEAPSSVILTKKQPVIDELTAARVESGSRTPEADLAPMAVQLTPPAIGNDDRHSIAVDSESDQEPEPGQGLKQAPEVESDAESEAEPEQKLKEEAVAEAEAEPEPEAKTESDTAAEAAPEQAQAEAKPEPEHGLESTVPVLAEARSEEANLQGHGHDTAAVSEEHVAEQVDHGTATADIDDDLINIADIPEGTFLPSTPELHYLEEHADLLEEHGFSDEEFEPLVLAARKSISPVSKDLPDPASSPPVMGHQDSESVLPDPASSPPVMGHQDSESVVSTSASFHTAESEGAASDDEQGRLPGLDERLGWNGRQHRRDASEITVTASGLSGGLEPLSSAAAPTRQSSAPDDEWPEPTSSPDMREVIRRRGQTRRERSPLAPRAGSLALRRQQNNGHELLAALVHRLCWLAVAKPIEVLLVLVHVILRIVGGATVNDLLSGELFRLPTPPARRSARLPPSAGQVSRKPAEPEDDADDADDYDVPIRGKANRL